MSTPFQNRLVGTIIVAAAAIIFLPDLLDGEKKAFKQQFEEIPKQPVIKINGDVKQFPEEASKELMADVIEDDANDLSDQLLDAAEQNSAETQTGESSANVKVTEDNSTSALSDVDEIEEEIGSEAEQTQLSKNIEHGSAWVIQLGSFRSKANIDSLVAKLKLNGYVVFTREINTSSGVMTKVYVGPEVDKSQLESQLTPLFELTKVKGRLSKFVPK